VAGSIEPATDRNQDAAAIHAGVLSAEKKVFGGLIVRVNKGYILSPLLSPPKSWIKANEGRF
jgi:hypothetical protein